MNTHDYLNSLTLEQLMCARDRADAMVKAKQAEKRRVVWCVESDRLNLHFYPLERYVEAAERLLEEAKKRESAKKQIREKRLSLVPVYVLESEYQQYEADFPPTASARIEL